MTETAIKNAIAVDMALGCSTNSMLHLPAIANECRVKFDLDEVNTISERTPNLCHLAPAGPKSIQYSADAWFQAATYLSAISTDIL